MQANISFALIALLSAFNIAYSQSQPEAITQQSSPASPAKIVTHVVELCKVQISDLDFNLSSLGNPLDISVALLEDGKEIRPCGAELGPITLSGRRGERFLKSPVRWVVDFDPEKNYQIIINEQSVVAQAYSYRIPATPKIGYWPIGVEEGLIHIGKESYFQFKDKIAQ